MQKMRRPHVSQVDNESGDKRILFNVCKDEQFNPSKGFKALFKRLRLKCAANKDAIQLEKLLNHQLFIIAGPRKPFTPSELEVLSDYVEAGKSLFILLGENGEGITNLNTFLDHYGVVVNNDVVVRTQFYKYFHPKECYVANGVLNRGILKAAGLETTLVTADDASTAQQLQFVYPYGCTLTVAKPSIPVLSSGSVSFPLNRPVCSFFTHRKSGGKLVVLGSPCMFSDTYIDKENNFKIFNVIFKYLTTDEVSLNAVDSDDPDVSDYNYIPDSKMLSEQLKVCLQESEELPTDRHDWFVLLLTLRELWNVHLLLVLTFMIWTSSLLQKRSVWLS